SHRRPRRGRRLLGSGAQRGAARRPGGRNRPRGAAASPAHNARGGALVRLGRAARRSRARANHPPVDPPEAARAAARAMSVRSLRAAQTVLPAMSALYCADGVIGVYTHVQGVRKRPGGFAEPLYNIVMGPPLLAPGSLALVGAMGMLAAGMQRER